MSNIVWLGALLAINICFALPQSPGILVQPGSSSPNIISLSINTKKYVHTISDHFLSITLEPSTIFSALQKNPNFGSNVINMAKGLNPAFVRISGPECNYFRFQGGQETSESLSILPVKYGKNNLTITGWHWSQLNEFLDKTGLDLIVGLNVMSRQHGSWDLSNTLDLISYSDKHGYRMAFQLGNDIQVIGSRIDGTSLGRDAVRLRKVLEAFPRYMSSSIISPDIKSCETQEEARYLKNLIIESGPSLSALTYQVPFSSEKNVENPTEIFSYIQNQMESRVWQKDPNSKFLGKIAAKKPLWIVESGVKDRRGDFTDGLIWAQRLCAGARVGINTILRKPSLLSLSEPTSDYWVSVLHKALVGSEVFDIKISSGNKTSLETVAHCTKMSPYDPFEGILAPEYRYNRGGITVFGVNMGSENVKILLKTGEKQSLPLHQYLLTANNKQFAKRYERSLSTLLNGQKLFLSSDGELPIVSPRIRGSHQLITIPSQSIFFLVLPEIRSKACMAVQMEESKESYKNSGRIVDQEEFDISDYDSPILDQEDEWTSNEKNTYVAFRPKYTKNNDGSIIQQNDKQELKNNNNEIAVQNNEELHNNGNIHQVEPVVKYVTFSNNNWLSKFPKALNSQEYSMESSTLYPIEASITEIQTEKSISPLHSKREKYHILAQAVAGKRYSDKNIRSDLYPNLDSTLTSHRASQKLKLIKRTVDNSDLSSKDLEEIIKQFGNKEKGTKNRSIKSYESSSEVPLIPKEDDTNVFENLEKKVTTDNPSTQDVQQSTITSQTTITSMPVMSTAKVVKQGHAKIESRIQKIKTKAEQALVKANERTSQKGTGRRWQEKFKGNEINNFCQKSKSDEKLMTSTEIINTSKKPTTIENITNLTDKIRYNRQTIGITTNSDLKTVRPCLRSKSKKSEIADAENLKTINSITESTYLEPTEPTEIYIIKTPKLRNSTSKPLKPSKLKSINGKSNIRDGRETTQQSVPKLKTKLTLHPLGVVKTSPNVDIDQVVTNEKIVEIIAENISDGKKTLQSEQIINPVDKIKENKLETKTIAATARLKELEEKIKIHRSEIERRLHERTHKVKKRSPINELIENDIIDNKILNPTNKFESNELDVDVLPVSNSDTVYRYPRSMADFTLKLNEVNTYVDKNRRAIDPKNNEIFEDNDNVGSLKYWKNTNDIPLSAEENSRVNDVNTKSKRKTIFQEIDEDDYSITTSHMMNKLMNHMQALWRYLKRTLRL